LRNVLRKGAADRCKKMNWGEVRYGDSIRLMQKDWTQVPMQPNPESRERRLREVQTTILGADYFKDMDPK